MILGGSRGVIIAQDPRNGAIRAMASSPRFDPNHYARALQQSSSNPERPLYHRAVKGTYPPGSVFKCFELLPILEDLKLSPYRSEYCSGRFPMTGQRCHKRTGHGHMNMFAAVQKSCDVYFYSVIGTKLGIDRLAVWANEFGLNGNTGIDLPQESTVPFPSRANRRYWYPGDTVNLSIGQGVMLLTPLQISNGMCAIANRGTVYKPKIAKEVRSPDGALIRTIEPEIAGKIEASTKSWDIVHRALWEVMYEPSGTGRHIITRQDREEKFILGGKTGTAEAPPKNSPTHAWFVLYAGENGVPEIVITVLVERGGHGGEHASPLAKKLLEVYRNRVGLEDLV